MEKKAPQASPESSQPHPLKPPVHTVSPIAKVAPPVSRTPPGTVPIKHPPVAQAAPPISQTPPGTASAHNTPVAQAAPPVSQPLPHLAPIHTIPPSPKPWKTRQRPPKGLKAQQKAKEAEESAGAEGSGDRPSQGRRGPPSKKRPLNVTVHKLPAGGMNGLLPGGSVNGPLPNGVSRVVHISTGGHWRGSRQGGPGPPSRQPNSLSGPRMAMKLPLHVSASRAPLQNFQHTQGFCSGKSGEVTSSAGEGLSTDGMALSRGEEAWKDATEEFSTGKSGGSSQNAGTSKTGSEREDEKVLTGERKEAPQCAIMSSLEGDREHAANCTVEESSSGVCEDALERAFEEFVKEEAGGFREEETENFHKDSAGGVWEEETDGFLKGSTRETQNNATERESELEEVPLGQSEMGANGDRHEWADGVEKVSKPAIEGAMEEVSPKGAEKASEALSGGKDDRFSKAAAEGTREEAAAECLKEGAVDAARGWSQTALTGSANGTVLLGSSDVLLKDPTGIFGQGDEVLHQTLKDAVDETRNEGGESGLEGVAAMRGSRDILEEADTDQVGGVPKKSIEGPGEEATQNLKDAVEESLEIARGSILAGGAEGAANGASNEVVGALSLEGSGDDLNGASTVSTKDQGTSDVSRKQDANSNGNGLGLRKISVSEGMRSPKKEPSSQVAVVASQGVEEQESLRGSGPLGCKEGAPQVCDQQTE
jgi:hypothetical protein